MKVFIMRIFLLISIVAIMLACTVLTVSAHQIAPWANYYKPTNAGGNNHFGILPDYHIDGNTVNYYWATNSYATASEAKSYFASAMTGGVSAWGGIINAVEKASSSSSHMRVVYEPYCECNGYWYHSTGEGHIGLGDTVSKLAFGPITGQTQVFMSYVAAHELGHIWRISDLKGIVGLESIYAMGSYSVPTRHDKNAMYIGVNNRGTMMPATIKNG